MDIIKAGRVKVNGCVVREPSTDVIGTEHVTVDNCPVETKQYTYLMLHKPAGYTTTKDDPHAEKTVMELLPKNLHHLSPVGRLDRETEGLLLFTNDGTWAQEIMHPKFHLDKTYLARMEGQLKDAEEKKLEAGIALRGEQTLPCRIFDVHYNGTETQATITIQEGRKRQVRMMFQSVGHRVVYLKRLAVGKLQLGDLKLGQWRELKKTDV